MTGHPARLASTGSSGDKVLLVYRSLYPSKWLPDALELETLAKEVLALYGIDLAAVWSDDLTLGEIFSLTSRRGAASA